MVQERQESVEVGQISAKKTQKEGTNALFCVFSAKIPVLTLCDKMGMYIGNMGQILIQNFGPIVNRGASSKLRFLVVFKERRKNIPKRNNYIEI